MIEPLQEVRIVDFSRVLAGPLATMLLADFGAQVLKVERPGVGDDTRAWGPPFDDCGEATYFHSINRNKVSSALDLGDPGDLGRARQLALEADVLVENFRPGLMAEAGMDHATLATANPGLVYCSVTGFGGRGAGAGMPGYDLLIQAVGGLMSLTGEPDEEPLKVGVALVDVICGAFAALGILAALEQRRRTGRGQLVEVDLLSSLLAAMPAEGAALSLHDELPGRSGNADPCFAPCEVLRVGEEEMVLAIGDDDSFADLCDVLGAPTLARDPRFATNRARVEHREILRGRLTELLAARGIEDWLGPMRDRGLAAGRVSTLDQAFSTAADLGLDPTVSIPRHTGGPLRLTRNPIQMSRTPASYRLAPPPLPTPSPEGAR
ncbi:MAG: CoA transferase [Solirubrobacterales bacterium]